MKILPKAIYHAIQPLYHYCVSACAAVWYGFPSRRLFVVGVTGTKGKSTVVELMNAIFERHRDVTALCSSVRFKIGDQSWPNETGNTMPGRFMLQRFLRQAADAGCRYVFIEVTSQGVLLSRHRFIDFDAAVVTNLQPEHIEAHGSFENYRRAKTDFFRYVAQHSRKPRLLFFVNRSMDDKRYFIDAIHNKGTLVEYDHSDADKLELAPTFFGEFNAENIAAAAALAREEKIDWQTIKEAIENFSGVPGRLEFIQQTPFAVLIDYAHTPDSLEKVYATIRSGLLKKGGRLIGVLGAAGGGRDTWKRPAMGKIAGRYCDIIFITNEDPFDEDPRTIIADIEKGIAPDQRSRVTVEIDRTAAIKLAIQSAQPGDVVVITGKGSERYIRIAHKKKIPWNEREVTLQALNQSEIRAKEV